MYRLKKDGEFKELARKSTIVLPYEMRGHVAIGESLIVEFGHVVDMEDK